MRSKTTLECSEVDKPEEVYSMGCDDCDQVYVGETARNSKVQVKEYPTLARNRHPELSAVAEHALGGHAVDWLPKVLRVANRTMERRIKELLRINVQGDRVMTRHRGLELSKSWLSLLC